MYELSGPLWIKKFPGSVSTKELSAPFRENVENFILALRNAGAVVRIAATLRPPERAYLMHWSWKLSRRLVKPESIPRKPNINIEWEHDSYEKSVKAAFAMVNAYGMSRLNVAPALKSRHTEGNAIDMSISWAGALSIFDHTGTKVVITTSPKDGMNKILHEIGKSYGVIKYHGGSKDKPHWSVDGR